MDAITQIMFFIGWFLIIALNVVLLTYLSVKYKTSAFLIGAVSAYIILANVLSTKLISFLGLIVPAGVIVYSLIYLITDLISEKYGKSKAHQAVISGFIMNVMFIILIYFTVFAPPMPGEQGAIMNENFKEMFTLTARIIAASLIAYIISQTFDVMLYHFIKEKTQSKHLWLRNNASTWISQFIDTILFITIAFYGILPTAAITTMILSQYIVKIGIALADTPFLYWGVKLFNKLK